MDTTKISSAITVANTELNIIIDTTYKEAKASGKGFNRLQLLSQAANALARAEKNLKKFAEPKPAK